MSHILDPSGKPLPPSRPVVDGLTKMCELYDGSPNGWSKVAQRYELILSQMEPYSQQMIGALSGAIQLDLRNPQGQEMTRLAFDVAVMSLLFRRNAQREEHKENEEREQAGGQRAPDVG